MSDEQILRELLWLRHGCPTSALYGDDGEMQCTACRIDFKREAPAAIRDRFMAQALDRLDTVKTVAAVLTGDERPGGAPVLPAPPAEAICECTSPTLYDLMDDRRWRCSRCGLPDRPAKPQEAR